MDIDVKNESEVEYFEQRFQVLLHISLGNELLQSEHSVQLKDAYKLDFFLNLLSRRVGKECDGVNPKARWEKVAFRNHSRVSDFLSKVVQVWGSELYENIEHVNKGRDVVHD